MMQSAFKKIFVGAGVLAVSILSVVEFGHLGFAQTQNQQQQSGPTSTAAPSASPSASPAASPAAFPSGRPTHREIYQAVLSPSNVSGVNGTAVVVVDGDTAGVYLQASGLAADYAHPMAIYPGTLCPTSAADSNDDGFVDDSEAEAVTGAPFLPLTLDLGQATNRPARFPIAAQDGDLTYIGSISLDLLSAGKVPVLYPSASPNPGPSVSPSSIPSVVPSIGPSPSINPSVSPSLVSSPSPSESALAGEAGRAAFNGAFGGEVIEIHGLSPEADLPSTVAAGNSGLPAWQSIPVACGTLQQVNE